MEILTGISTNFTVAVVMVAGLVDHPEHARELADFPRILNLPTKLLMLVCH